MSSIVFDIETGPLEDEQLQNVVSPFDPLSVPHPGEFDPDSVKTGNLKDQSKIQAKIEEARAKHAADVAAHNENLQKAERDYWADVKSKAALSALTGRVLAIGYQGKKFAIDGIANGKNEMQILTQFWRQFIKARENQRKMLGWNISGFDIPFLCQRSYILGVDIPNGVFTNTGFLDFAFVDLMTQWARPMRSGFVKLDTACRACGLPGKLEGVSGADFAGLYLDPDTRETAIEYLAQDIRATAMLAERMGHFVGLEAEASVA